MPNEGNQSESAAQSSGVSVSAGGNVTTGDHVARDKITHNYYGPLPTPNPSPEDESPAPGVSPFKGLEYFNEADADLFFGREALTAKLVSHLRKHQFLAVVGASGSGKSSLVRAGLVPALKRGEPLADPTPLRFGDYSGALPPEGSTLWPIHIITPTSHPLEALAASLTRNSESVTATATFIDDLARDPRSLHLYVRKILSGPPTHAPSPIGGFPMGEGRGGGRLLLLIDQFEELFTLCHNESERQAFVDNLLTAVAPETGGPTIVVLTLRADFYAHCAQYADLREALATRQEYIGPMSADELRRAIEEPAKRGNWNFEEGLVDLLLREVGNEPGALPLLSHALLETWKRRRGRTLTLKGYTDSGGVRGAIAKTAETVFKELKPEQQTIARSIFLRLTELGEGTQDTRRRAALTELIPRSEDKAAVEAVLKTLADARLITTDKETAEVAHEALIREWPTLRRWLDDDREGLQIHRHLTEAAQEWDERKRDESELYRGGRLSATREWAEDHTDELNTLEREFLDASRALQANELEVAKKLAEEQQKRAEVQERLAEEQKERAREAKKQATQLRRSALFVFLAVVPALGLMLYTNLEQRRLATIQAQEDAQRLARLAATQQQQLIEGARQLLIAMTQLREVRRGDKVACNKLMASLLKQYPLYVDLGVIELDGDVVCSAIPLSGPVNVSDRVYFRHALETGGFSVGDYQIGRLTSKATVNFGYPVLDDANQPEAVAFVALDLAWLNRLATEAQLPTDSIFVVVDRLGTILVRYPDPEKWVGQTLPEAPVFKTILAQPSLGTADVVGVDGIERLYAFASLSSSAQSGAYVSIGLSKAVTFAGADHLLARNMLGLGAVAVFALEVAWFGVVVLNRRSAGGR